MTILGLISIIRKFHQFFLKKTQENSKEHMNMNTRTPNSTFMKVQVRTINLNRTKGAKVLKRK